ncbi:MAG: 8-amino-7-oxononanoate synthase [Clostridiales bacterium]
MIDFNYEISKIKEKGLYRSFRYLESAQDSKTFIDGKKVILLASNNYLGLCNNEILKKSAIEAINKYGVGSGGSRLTTGSYVLHKELEKEIAKFKGTEDAILFNTGYMANIGTIASIVDSDWVIFCDRLNHASIIDGCRLSNAKLVIYKHCDVNDLMNKIKKYNREKSILITESIFSMDGDIAPLDKIVELTKKNNILTMVDEAHSTGIIGNKGKGVVDYFNLSEKIDIQVGTFSKALASEGGFVVGENSLIEYLKQKARSFIYSTALSPQTIAVSLAALRYLNENSYLIENLISKTIWFRDKLKSFGFNIIDGITPIIPIIVGDTVKTVDFSEKLLNEGIYIPAIRPPTVPKGTSRLRISLMESHTKEDLESSLNLIRKIGKKINII